MANPTEVEAMARGMHADVCNRRGIFDEQKIASYWDGCWREMYRKRARDLLDNSLSAGERTPENAK